MKENEKELVPFVILARYYNTTLTEKYRNRKVWHNPVPGEVRSHLPGTIVSIAVEAGQHVEKGQLLLIHEAMKMENRVVAPMAGTVSSIGVTAGEKVKKDELMVSITPDVAPEAPVEEEGDHPHGV